MKILAIILLLVIPTQQVKQYRIYKAEEDNEKYLVDGYAAITSENIFLKIDTSQYTFCIMKSFNDGIRNAYFLGKDIIAGDDTLAVYRGICIVQNNGINTKTNREEGFIYLECRNAKYHRTVIYSYR